MKYQRFYAIMTKGRKETVAKAHKQGIRSVYDHLKQTNAGLTEADVRLYRGLFWAGVCIGRLPNEHQISSTLSSI